MHGISYIILGILVYFAGVSCQTTELSSSDTVPVSLSDQDHDHSLGVDFIDEDDLESYRAASDYEPFSPEGLYVYFDSNQSSLSKASKLTLKKIINGMKRDPLSRIIIRAHTDSVGSHKINMELSRKRASNIKSYLVQQGVAAERLHVDYAGESELVQRKSLSKEDRRSSRRAEFILDYQLQRFD